MTQQTKAGWKLEQTYAELPEIFFSKMEPNPVASPDLVVLNEPLAKELGLDPEVLADEEDILAGNEVPEGSEPIAQAYAGHQFGQFTMLGDGRALLFGEQITPSGKRVDIQLKGSGRTKFSRGGDGRAALGPMLREYIISEAMHGLGIPTSRSLAVTITGETVRRERMLTGAVLTRVASSHLRVGTFEYAVRLTEAENVKALADYAITRHYSEAASADNPYLELLRGVMKNQASLIAKWQRVGFIHGVMNTDNMTISGESIDYGPCAFMNNYDPSTVFSSIDAQGRYAYGSQPHIGGWNLARFAESLVPLLHENQEEAISIAQQEMNQYGELYEAAWLNEMRNKLGLMNEEPGDKDLIVQLLNLMHKEEADFTNTFRKLTLGEVPINSDDFKNWSTEWNKRLERQDASTEEVQQLMKQHNPNVIPRNHRVEEAIEAAVERDDFSVMYRLLDVLKDPYAYSDEQTPYCNGPDPEAGTYRTFCGT
ncbi:protein adenylyltransferase SelO [Jeotgalibacillus salarius]|uniref:Protein nucleotidyltransferase YdiU n=1 Tax=Jeotgalibacillus salarius TaxID=546023 RepID=A0A4Y8LIP9_9BACL|nr:YdiU family protein [Jeotgalibacillus salarius]TFE02261.1 YdiU family protein [Jeotgalibacillus salarius]